MIVPTQVRSGAKANGGTSEGLRLSRPSSGLPLNPAELAKTISREVFERLCLDRETLKHQLFEAPPRSIVAIDLADKLSIVVGTIDEYILLHGGKA